MVQVVGHHVEDGEVAKVGGEQEEKHQVQDVDALPQPDHLTKRQVPTPQQRVLMVVVMMMMMMMMMTTMRMVMIMTMIIMTMRLTKKPSSLSR
jgi:hypothetical protein